MTASFDSLPRLVVSDLDGTLLRSDGSVSAYTRDVLARVEDAGATVVFATGRPPRWMDSIVEATGHRGIAVCSNGALVYDLHEARVIERHPLTPEVCRALIEVIRAAVPGASFGVELGDAFIHEASYPIPQEVVRETTVGEVADLVSEPALKLLVKHADHDPDTLLAKAREVAGGLAELTHSSRVGLLEISARGVSKATTLALLCEERGIDSSDVLAFGDMPNDLAMLAWAGTSYAVENAHPEVLAAVERRCPPNDEDGVARVLGEIFSAG